MTDVLYQSLVIEKVVVVMPDGWQVVAQSPPLSHSLRNIQLAARHRVSLPDHKLSSTLDLRFLMEQSLLNPLWFSLLSMWMPNYLYSSATSSPKTDTHRTAVLFHLKSIATTPPLKNNSGNIKAFFAKQFTKATILHTAKNVRAAFQRKGKDESSELVEQLVLLNTNFS